MGGNVSAPSDGKKSLQDTGFTILLFSILTFFHDGDSGSLSFVLVWFVFRLIMSFLYGRSKFCIWWSVCKQAPQRLIGHFIVFILLPVCIVCMRVYVFMGYS